jgi:hypothetical protein
MSTFLVGRENYTISFMNSDQKNSWPTQLINIGKKNIKPHFLITYVDIYVDNQEQPNCLKINKNNNLVLTCKT